MQIVREVIDELKTLGIEAVVDDVAATGSRKLWTPWTMATVTFADDMRGRAAAGNRYAMPADPALVQSYLGKDAFGVLEALLAGPRDDFDVSLAYALLSALSVWVWDKPDVFHKQGLTCVDLAREPWDPTEYVLDTDTVVFCGFAPWEVQAVRDRAAHVLVVENEPRADFGVYDPRDTTLKVEMVQAADAAGALRRADVLFISGDTLLDDRLDFCLEKSSKARTYIIYGPTASFYPLPLITRGVHAVMAVCFPGSDGFRRGFLENRGYWYAMPGVRAFLVSVPLQEAE